MKMEPKESIPQDPRITAIAEACLLNAGAYRLFHMLGNVSLLDSSAKLAYLELVREANIYSEEEIQAIARLVLSGNAQRIVDIIDKEWSQRIQREIAEMTQ